MADAKIYELLSATVPLSGTDIFPIIQGGVTKKVSVVDITDGRAVTTGALTVKGSLSVSGFSSFPGSAGYTLGSSSYFYNSDNTNYYYLTNSGATGTGNGVLDFVLGGVGTALSLNAVRDITITAGNLTQGTAAKGINFTANTPAAGKTSQLLNWYEEGTWTPNQGAGLTVVGAFSSSGTYTRIGRQVTVRGQVAGATSIAVAAAGVISSNLPFAAAISHAGNMFNAATTASSSIQITSSSVVAAGAITATPSITFTATYTV